MINYLCDICGKNIGDRRYYHETPKYEVHIRKQSNSFKPGGKTLTYSDHVDICDECQEKVNAALDPIFKDIVDKVEGPFPAMVADGLISEEDD